MSSGYTLGAGSYSRKPVDLQELIEAVRQLGLHRLHLNSRLISYLVLGEPFSSGPPLDPIQRYRV